MTLKNSAVILLSGGLDSLVALDCIKRDENISVKLALTFEYGQKALTKELEASKRIAEHYGLEHRIIKLDWLKDITKTALVGDSELPKENLNTEESAASVWVPNRNALFLNIAACFCDAIGFKYIVYGANKDEGQTFPDNTESFREQISDLFKTSTLVQPRVLTPLINYGKDDIVRIAVENSVPLELVWSCYKSGDKHCGECESCMHLKKALVTNRCKNYINLLFEDEN